MTRTSARMSPNQREILSAQSTVTSKQEYLTSTGGVLNVSSSGGGGGGTSSNFSATFPTAGTAIGASDGTNMQPLKVDGSGYLEVNIETGSVTANAGTNLNTSALATQTTLAAILVRQNDGSQNTSVTNSSLAVTQGTAASLNATVVGTGTFAAQVASSTATGSSVPSDAYYCGGLASTALPTATTAADLVGAMYDKFGRTIVIPQAPRDLVGFQTTTFTASTSSTTVLTGVSNIFSDITSVALANSGASATLFTLSDGTNSYSFYVPAGDMRGAVYQVPLAATTVDTNWTGQCGTSTSSLICTITYIKNR